MNRYRVAAVIFFSSIGLGGCTASTPTQTKNPARLQQANPAPREVAADVFDVRLRRSGCYGKCPSYAVTIRGDGAVEFKGERFVAATGTQYEQIPAPKMAALRNALRDPSFAALADDYTPAGPACGLWSTDAATVTMELMLDGRHRTITHYLGCEGAPVLLRGIKKLIDDSADVERWISGASAY